MRIDVARRDLQCGDATPRGYRMAWYDFCRQRAVCYPAGIHVIAWAIRRLWNATFYPLPEGEAQKLRDQIAIYEQQRVSHFDAMHNLRVELRDAELMIGLLNRLPAVQEYYAEQSQALADSVRSKAAEAYYGEPPCSPAEPS